MERLTWRQLERDLELAPEAHGLKKREHRQSVQELTWDDLKRDKKKKGKR